jgi:TonB family protein
VPFWFISSRVLRPAGASHSFCWRIYTGCRLSRNMGVRQGFACHSVWLNKITIRAMGHRMQKTQNRLFVPMVATICLLVASVLHADIRKTAKTVPPVYPALALKMRIEGTVKVQVVVNDDGSVADVKVVSGHTLLTQAAVDCVKKWQYERGDGKSIQPATVEFTLPH